MKTYNNTQFDPDQFASEEPLKIVCNNWRQRTIRLYAHPTDTDRVVSVGVSFDLSTRVVADESRSEWARELESRSHFVTTN